MNKLKKLASDILDEVESDTGYEINGEDGYYELEDEITEKIETLLKEIAINVGTICEDNKAVKDEILKMLDSYGDENGTEECKNKSKRC